MSKRKLRLLLLPCNVAEAANHALFSHVALYQIRAYLNQFEYISHNVEIEALQWKALVSERGQPSESISALCGQIQQFAPDIVAFSLYVWSIESCVRLASVLKQMYPGVLIIAGGPEVAGREQFVVDFPEFDVVVQGEGELSTRLILERLMSGDSDLTGIPNISFRSAEGMFVHGPFSGETEDPARLPNFWSEGPYDKESTARIANYTGARGCNMHCLYCLNPTQRFVAKSSKQVVAEIAAIAARPDVDTIFAVDFDLYDAWKAEPEMLATVARSMREGQNPRLTFFANPQSLSDPAFMDAMEKFRISEIYVGVQTTNRDALAAVGRSWTLKSLDQFGDVPESIRRMTTLQMMLPLPCETPETFYNGLQHFVNLGYYRFQVFPTVIMRGTEIHRQAAKLGLKYLHRSPYYCFETPTFSVRDWVDACAVGQFFEVAMARAFENPDHLEEGWLQLSEFFRRYTVLDIANRVRDRGPVGQVIDDLLSEVGLGFAPVSGHQNVSPSVNIATDSGKCPEDTRVSREIFPTESVLKNLAAQNNLLWDGEEFDGWRLSLNLVEDGCRVVVMLFPATDNSPCYREVRHLKLAYSGSLKKVGMLDDLSACIEHG
jgi:radical SAM superfamily enzyme YgiQ (UPF0313 family)